MIIKQKVLPFFIIHPRGISMQESTKCVSKLTFLVAFLHLLTLVQGHLTWMDLVVLGIYIDNLAIWNDFHIFSVAVFANLKSIATDIMLNLLTLGWKVLTFLLLGYLSEVVQIFYWGLIIAALQIASQFVLFYFLYRHRYLADLSGVWPIYVLYFFIPMTCHSL